MGNWNYRENLDGLIEEAKVNRDYNHLANGARYIKQHIEVDGAPALPEEQLRADLAALLDVIEQLARKIDGLPPSAG